MKEYANAGSTTPISSLHRRRVLPAHLPARALGPVPLAEAARRQAGAAGQSLRVAHAAGTLRGQDLKRVTVDTAVQPKAITLPIDAKLLHAAIKGSTAWRDSTASGCGNPIFCVAKAAAMMRMLMQTIRAASAAVAYPAPPAGPDHPRHPSQDQGPTSTGGRSRIPRRSNQPDPLTAAAAAPLAALYFRVPEVECIGKGKAGRAL